MFVARPRLFDEQRVLAQIVDVFWEKGFEGTSMDDLVKRTGLNKGSLYTCFGNKEEIFKQALRQYATSGPFHWRKEETPLETLRSFYNFLISEAALPKKQRRGCFVFNSCLEFGNKSAKLTPVVMAWAKRTESFFVSLIQEAQDADEISKNLNVRKAAQIAFAAAFTIREMTKFKPDKEFLSDIAEVALGSLMA